MMSQSNPDSCEKELDRISNVKSIVPEIRNLTYVLNRLDMAKGKN